MDELIIVQLNYKTTHLWIRKLVNKDFCKTFSYQFLHKQFSFRIYRTALNRIVSLRYCLCFKLTKRADSWVCLRWQRMVKTEQTDGDTEESRPKDWRDRAGDKIKSGTEDRNNGPESNVSPSASHSLDKVGPLSHRSTPGTTNNNVWPVDRQEGDYLTSAVVDWIKIDKIESWMECSGDYDTAAWGCCLPGWKFKPEWRRKIKKKRPSVVACMSFSG